MSRFAARTPRAARAALVLLAVAALGVVAASFAPGVGRGARADERDSAVSDATVSAAVVPAAAVSRATVSDAAVSDATASDATVSGAAARTRDASENGRLASTVGVDAPEPTIRTRAREGRGHGERGHDGAHLADERTARDEAKAAFATSERARGGAKSEREDVILHPRGGDVPATLHATGLFVDATSTRVAPDVLAYEPQYPLWTDGATKRRWMRLPPGAWVDASDVDHWVFPRGTQLWKEFSFGRRVETRYLTLDAQGTWRFATYVWDDAGRGATLAPERGVPAACESRPGVPFDVPARTDCAACHAAGPDVVLGVSALQLSSDRDPLAPNAVTPADDAVDLDELVRRGLVRGLPARFVDEPPRIRARTPRERAALGYLHANCGACHTSSGALGGLDLDLSYRLAATDVAPALVTALDRPSRFRWPNDADPLRLASACPDRSVLTRRMASTQPLSRMPPLGTRVRDEAALALLTNWLRDDVARAHRPVTESLPDATRPR